MPVVTNAELASAVQQVVSRVDAREDQLTAWQAGTPEGGPFADGTYAITNLLGETSYFKSPARLQYEVGLLTTAGTGAVATAEAARDAAEAALASAVVQATNASSSASTASTKASEAQVFRNEAANSEANALAHRNAASASASAAALSEADAEAAAIAAAASAASADADATAAAASAAAAATFDPVNFYTKTQADTLLAAKLATADFSWNNLAGKPTTFTPSAHTHAIADVTGLQTALDGKQAAGSYAAAVHGHSIADVTGLQAALDGKQAAGSYAAASHTHVIADVTGLQAALDSKQPAGSYLTGITGSMVTTALGYTPYNSSNPAGYISGITSGMVTTELGYTPANKAGDTFTGAVTFPGGTLVSIDGGIRARFNNGNTGAVYFGSGDNYLYYNATNFTLSGGYVYNANSFHAPIFYDSDNTGYYVDPSGTTYLNTLQVNGGYNVYRALGSLPGNNVSWNAVGNDNYGSVQVTQENFNLGGAAGNAGYPDSASYKYGILLNFQAQSSAQGQVYISHAGNDLIFRGGWGGSSWQTWNKALTDQNYTSYAMPANSAATNTVSVSAPVYYDYNNTNYYLDPTSSSTSIYTGGTAMFSNMDMVLRSNGIEQWSTNAEAEIAVNYVGYAGGTTQWRNFRVFDGKTSARLSVYGGANYTEATGSIRAPIFYDSNNTAYYVDPANTGTALNVAGSLVMDTGGGERTVTFGFTGRSVYFFGRDSDDVVGLYDNVGGIRWQTDVNGNFTAGSSSRAPVFYDSNDTAYYVDPHGTSYLNAGIISGEWKFRSNKGNGVYSGASSAPPLQAYSDDGGAAFMSFHRGGAYAVNFGLDPDNYLRIGGWSASANRWVLDMNGNNWITGSFHAPVFYDSNDTGFYADATGNSRFRNICLGGGSGFDATIHIVGAQGGYDRLTQMSPDAASKPALNIMASRNSGNGDQWWSWGVQTDNTWKIQAGVGFGGNGITVDGSGNFTATGNVTAYSDARLKKEVETIRGALGLVSQLRGVRYTRIDSGERHVGVIAQETLSVIPEVVQQGTGDDDTLSVAYGNLVGVLIEAIKELRAEVEALKNA